MDIQEQEFVARENEKDRKNIRWIVASLCMTFVVVVIIAVFAK